jgi:uncharacterized protein (DUF924 family)
MAMSPDASPRTVLDFWRAAGSDRWFKVDKSFDQDVRERFLELHDAAATGQLDRWAQSAEGALALLILLDQFPRNMFRGTPRAFATDAKALAIARQAVESGFDRKVEPAFRTFFYLPFMHSEVSSDQDYCCALYRWLGEAEGIKYAELHRDAIRRFGRFPHRNEILGRRSTPEEIAYLAGGGFSG